MTICKDCENIKDEKGTSIIDLLTAAESHIGKNETAEAKAMYEESLRLLMEFNGCVDCKDALIQAIKEL